MSKDFASAASGMTTARMPADGGVQPSAVRPRPWAAVWRLSREQWIVFGAVILIVTFRSALFVFRESLSFDSDEAVTGLMAKHLVGWRAFPLFFYGQNYMLGVEAWLAAPVFLALGASVATLKLPLLALNIAVGLLLVRLLEREVGLRPGLALVASLFFLIPPLGSTSVLLGAIGGNVEPFLYALLLWRTRYRPAWFGLILGVGFLQREFTIYAALGVIAVEMLDGAWRHQERRRDLWRALRVVAEVWLVVQFLRTFASPAGPGSTLAAISNAPGNNLIELSNRLCVDPRTFLRGVQRLVTVHWTQLFGIEAEHAYSYGIESNVPMGLAGSGFVFGAAALVVFWRIARQFRLVAARWTELRFCLYLTLVGAISAGVYVVGRCGADSALRYDMLALLGAVGLGAWFFAVEDQVWFRRVGVIVIAGWALVSGVPHARLWIEQTSHPPVAAKAMIIRNLDARGIKYAMADYWIAYYITFMTDERIIVAAETFARMPDYERIVLEHRAEAIRISRQPCDDGKMVVEGVYFCPLN
ncbi:MAG: hypothetical protein ABI868_23200 [Acidobacteriota bacterium]